MDQRKACSLYHFLGTLVVFIPILGMLGPALLNLFRKKQTAEEENHYRMVINFQISFVLYALILQLFVPPNVALALVIILAVLALMMLIYNGVLALKGKEISYPLAIRFLKPVRKTMSIDDMMLHQSDSNK